MTNNRVGMKEFLLKQIKEADDKDDKAEVGRLLQKAKVPAILDSRSKRKSNPENNVSQCLQ
jgi:hypothetical protein